MTREEVAERIARELLNNDVLDINNYSNDTQAAVDDAQLIVLEVLQDYILIKGTIIK